MEEKTIRSVSPVPFGLIMGAVSGVAGLIGTLLFTVFYLPFMSTFSESFNPVPGTPTTSIFPGALGLVIVIVIPIVAFIMGFVQGLLSAVIYNFLAPRIGGIKIQFEDTSQAPS